MPDPFSLVAQLAGIAIGIATLWLVVLERVEKRRAWRPVYFEVSVVGVITHDDEHAATRLRLANLGWRAGTFEFSRLVNATPVLTNNTLPPRTIPAHGHHDFDVVEADLDDAWLFIVYTDHADDRFLLVEWLPVRKHGPLGQAHIEQWQAVPQRRRARTRYLRRTRVVGPEAEPMRIVKLKRPGLEEALLEAGRSTEQAPGHTLST